MKREFFNCAKVVLPLFSFCNSKLISYKLKGVATIIYFIPVVIIGETPSWYASQLAQYEL